MKNDGKRQSNASKNVQTRYNGQTGRVSDPNPAIQKEVGKCFFYKKRGHFKNNCPRFKTQ